MYIQFFQCVQRTESQSFDCVSYNCAIVGICRGGGNGRDDKPSDTAVGVEWEVA